MDVQLLTGLSVAAGLIAASVSIACLIRIEDLHRDLRTYGPRSRQRKGLLRGRGKVLHLHGEPPPHR
ncbi:MAG TPA: hypothetical protein VNT75_06200 [Symbiobacteriaceae bacterium]|nr:hypothetical protein [Symbiobacteriaceae bacterium]